MVINHFNRIHSDKDFVCTLNELEQEITEMSAGGKCAASISSVVGVPRTEVDSLRADIYIAFTETKKSA